MHPRKRGVKALGCPRFHDPTENRFAEFHIEKMAFLRTKTGRWATQKNVENIDKNLQAES